MKRVCFRFDIDTHKCIRDGVPNLLEVSREYEVPFTFFLNLGKAVSLSDSFDQIVKGKESDGDKITLSAYEKLGAKDFVIAALINPNNARYKNRIKELLDNPYCEVGIHGGKNHAKWQFHAADWSEERVENEIEWAISMIRKIAPDYQLSGFASPTFNHPDCLSKVLSQKGFQYSADLHSIDMKVDTCDGLINDVGINLLGEPGGVAFWESCTVKGMDNLQIRNEFIRSLEKNDTVVVYDHPYYAGMQCLDSIVDIIEYLLKNGVSIVSLGDINSNRNGD